MSIVLGLGLASLFRKVCNDKNCIQFKGPLVAEIDGKTFKHGENCYKYSVKTSDKCDTMKRTVDISTPNEIHPSTDTASTSKPEEVVTDKKQGGLFGLISSVTGGRG